MDELADVLTRQKQVLEVLVYRLEVLRHMLGKGETRFLPFATAEVDHAAGLLREIERDRAGAIERTARELGVGPAALTLRALAESDGPHGPLFDRLRAEFLLLTEELEGLVRSSKALAGRGMADVDRVLAMLSGGSDLPVVYGPDADRRRARPLGLRYEATL